jgi:hypothetical protein
VNCDYVCKGDSTKLCGGWLTIFVYDTSYSDSTYTTYNTSSSSYKGCFVDGSPRRMSGPSYKSFSKNNINMCIMYCGLNDYAYAGLEYG